MDAESSTLPLGDDGRAFIQVGTLPPSLQAAYDFEALWNHHPKEFDVVKMYDRLVKTPRWTQNYLRSYWYTGVMHEAVPLPTDFQPFLDWANAKQPAGNVDAYNHVLVNWYEDGSHYIGPHSDSEKSIRPNSPILSISLGQERLFRVRDKATKKIVLEHPMKDNTFLVMGGTMQTHYTHEVPKTAKAGVGRRINITLRCML